MLTDDFVKDFNDVQTMDISLNKVKLQLVEELMCRRKERLRALVEDIDFRTMTGMSKHRVLHNAIKQLKEMSPTDSRLLNAVEQQVLCVLYTFYGYIK